MPMCANRRSLILVPVILALGPAAAAAGGASAAPPPPDVAAFVDAERGFAQDAAARGITPAFVAAMAPASIVFRPAPVDAQEWFAAHPGNTEARLAWTPCYAEVSVGGDLGWTTGPWDYRRTAAEEPVAFGHYSTVWRRQADGTLRAVIDAGHQHARSGPEPLTWTRAGDAGRKPKQPKAPRRAAAEKALFATEQAYATAIGRDGWARALAAHADRDVRMGRDGAMQQVGSAAAGEALGAAWAQTAPVWSAPAGGASDAGDVGYTYGTVTPAGGERQAFLHVWRNPDGKRWRLALDVMTPAPEAPPGAK